MPRFLIEVSHSHRKEACDYAMRAFSRTGSHFITNAEWGCLDNVHKAWMIIEVPTKEEAERIIPPDFRKDSQVVTLSKLNPSDMEGLEQAHDN